MELWPAVSGYLALVFDGYYVSNVALLASYGLAHRMLAERGRTETTRLANINQLIAWEKQAALMLAIVLAVKVS